MDRKLIDYLPPVLRSVREYKTLTEAAQPEVVSLWDSLKNALDGQFPISADINALRRWEKILNIVPKATETLEERRIRILTKIGDSLPYTIRALRNMLDSIYGQGVCEASVDPDEYIFNCSVKSGSNAKTEIYAFLRRIVPANLPILIMLYCDLSIAVQPEGNAFFSNVGKTGTYRTGTRPGRSTKTDFNSDSIAAIVSASPFYFRVKLCGTSRCK